MMVVDADRGEGGEWRWGAMEEEGEVFGG
jgi:hypothetical protein